MRLLKDPAVYTDKYTPLTKLISSQIQEGNIMMIKKLNKTQDHKI